MSAHEPKHLPVLCNELQEFLKLSSTGVKVFIDGTAGEGGHTQMFLEASAPNGRVIAFDKDPDAVERVKERCGCSERLVLINESYSQMVDLLPSILKEIADKDNPSPRVDGLVLDLGLSSKQLDDPERGFSFMREGPLDMRFDPRKRLNAMEIVNKWPEKKLSDLLLDNDETWAKKISKAIVIERRKERIETTTQLADLIRRTIPRKFHPKRIDPSTKTFQALRIATNHELEDLEEFLVKLPSAMETCFKPKGRAAIISFHSTEDRIVKNHFRDGVQKKFFTRVTKKPVMASDDEIQLNSRARSARLRVIERSEA